MPSYVVWANSSEGNVGHCGFKHPDGRYFLTKNLDEAEKFAVLGLAIRARDDFHDYHVSVLAILE